MARQLGRGIRQFREAARNITREMGAEDLVDDLKDLNQARGSFGETVRKELGLDELGEFPKLSDVGEPEPAAPTDAAVFTAAVGAQSCDRCRSEALPAGPAADGTARRVKPRPVRKRAPRAKPEVAQAVPAPAAPAAPKAAPRPRRAPARTAKTAAGGDTGRPGAAPLPLRPRPLPGPGGHRADRQDQAQRAGMTRAEDRMTLMEHLGELRKRLFISAAALVLCMLAAAILQKYVFQLLLHPLPKAHKSLLTFSPSEPLLVSLEVWFYAGLILAAPIVIYEFWAFVGPAFTTGERKRILPIVGITAFLFLGGIVFGYWAGAAPRPAVPARLERALLQRPGPRRRLPLLRSLVPGRLRRLSSRCR